MGEIQIGVYSSITGERVSSGALVPSGKRWTIDEVIAGFVAETEEFVQSYFGEVDDFREKILDFDDILEKMRFMLRRIKKGLSPR